MEEAISIDNGRSPAAKVMDEAIDLAIEGRSPYPGRAAFIDSDTASAARPTKACLSSWLPRTEARVS